MKRVLSLILAVLMCVSLLPVGVLADEEAAEVPAEPIEEVVEIVEEATPATEPESDAVSAALPVGEVEESAEADSFVESESERAESVAEEEIIVSAEEPEEVVEILEENDLQCDGAATDNGFTAKAKGNTSVYIEPNSFATMEVTASCTAGEIRYQWYNGSNWSKIDGAITASYTATDITGYTSYCCRVSDEYGNSRDIWFYIHIDNGFTAKAKGKTNIYIEPNGSATFEVTASCTDGDISYQWYDNNYNAISGATSPTYTVSVITGYCFYYCVVRDGYNNSETIWFYIHIDNSFTAEARGNTDIYIEPNGSATMEVRASCSDGEISYKWYDSNYSAIAGATSPTYSVSDITGYTYYHCEVRDKYGNSEDIWFRIHIENDLHATVSGSDNDYSTYYIEPGDSITLEVAASCKAGDISYQWYDNNWNKIEGATVASYTATSITGNTYYTCRVSDEYGNNKEIQFHICIENGFTASAKSSTAIYVEPNGSATMEVTASCTAGEISYQWYDGSNWSEIDGATTASYTATDITGYTSYWCLVSDEYGNSMDIWFSIRIENGFTASANGTTEIYVEPNGSATMEVAASCTAGEISYQWYDNNRNRIEDATAASYTATDIAGYTSFSCRVSDEYGNSRDIWFYIHIENGFTARANGSTEIYVEPNGSATMEVTASCTAGEISYQWYDNNRNRIEGATAASYTATDIAGYTRFSCHVSDEYGNSRDIWFYIHIENGFTAGAEGSARFNVELNGSATLAVTASCRDGELRYQWYDGEWKAIGGATGSSLVLTNITRAGEYFCRVSDEYGNSQDVWFRISIENGFYARATQSTFTINPGDSVTMQVDAGCNTGELSYSWYVGGNSITSSSPCYTIENVNLYTYGECRVTDEYGNSAWLQFVIRIENGLTATIAGTNSTHERISVEPNADVVLMVSASCIQGELTYRWYKESNGPWEESGNLGSEESLTLENVTSSGRYFCEVLDIYGNTRYVNFEVYIENGLTAIVKGTNSSYKSISVAPGSDILLEVDAHCNSGDLTYKWYTEDNWDSKVESGAAFALENVNHAIVYWCVVSDDYGNSAEVGFNVSVENAFSAKVAGSRIRSYRYITVTAGESVTLSVEAGCSNGSLDYQWYCESQADEEYYDGPVRSDYSAISGATEASYTLTSVTAAGNYYCLVKDIYGNTATIWFYVMVDNAFYARAEKMAVAADENGTATLRVLAGCNDGDITYDWLAESEWGSLSSNEAVLTVQNVTGESWYYCNVRDEYGNSRQVQFCVYSDTGSSAMPAFTAQAEESRIEVSFGGSATMKVNVTGASDVTYRWYRVAFDDSGNQVGDSKIANASGSTYTVTNVTEYEQYYCIVSDGNSVWNVHFFVIIKNGLTAADSNTGSGSAVNTVDLGSAVTMSVTASCTTGSLTYRWYKSGIGSSYASQLIEDATGSSYTATDISRYTLYCCKVTDKYGNTASVLYYMYVNSGFSAEPEAGDVYVDAGGTAVLKVNAEGEELDYRWREFIESFYGGYNVYNTGSAHVDTLVVPKVFRDMQYQCIVTDAYGNTRYVDFNIHVNAASGWKTVDGKTYYFDESGSPVSGLQTIDGKTYFFSTADYTRMTGLVKYGGESYYFGKDGAMLTGRISVDGVWHYFDPETGAGVTDQLVTIGQAIYYFGEDGAMASSEWKDIEGKRYYFKKAGPAATGEFTIGGKEYLFGSDGVMFTGKIKISGKYYYYDLETGRKAISQWVTIDKDKYYFQYNGRMVVGLKKISNKYYWFDKDGKMVVSQWITLDDGEQHFFQYNGRMVVSQVKKINGKYYYLDENGVMARNAWIDYKEDTYYFQDNGRAATGTVNIDGTDYTFDVDGKLIS